MPSGRRSVMPFPAGRRERELRAAPVRKELSMSGLQVLLEGVAFGESPRWHNGRLWFSDWGAQEVVAVHDALESALLRGERPLAERLAEIAADARRLGDPRRRRPMTAQDTDALWGRP